MDTLIDFPTAGNSSAFSAAPTRYAVRQVLDQEYQKAIKLMVSTARQTRFKANNALNDSPSHNHTANESKQPKPVIDEENQPKVKKDFFGRIVHVESNPREATDGSVLRRKEKGPSAWVTFHEGFSDAVRKPITLEEILRIL